MNMCDCGLAEEQNFLDRFSALHYAGCKNQVIERLLIYLIVHRIPKPPDFAKLIVGTAVG